MLNENKFYPSDRDKHIPANLLNRKDDDRENCTRPLKFG